MNSYLSLLAVVSRMRVLAAMNTNGYKATTTARKAGSKTPSD